MKKVSKTLAIVLCLVMILSLTALANWTTIGGNNNHNGVVTAAPTSTTPSITQFDLMNAGGGWDGIDTSPLMRTVTTTETNDGVTTTTTTTYAYVLYDAHASGGHLAKINCSAATPYTVWDKQVSGGSGFQLSTPLLVPGTTEANDVIYLASSLSDKYTLTNVSDTFPASLSNGVQKTVTASISSLATASNRVAMGIYLGQATTPGAISTTGTAIIDIGGSAVTLYLSPNNSGSGVNYKTYEQEVYDASGNVIAYDYYWYINHNVTGTANSAATVTVKVTLNGGTGSIQYLDVYANQASIQKIEGLDATAATGVTNTTIYGAVNGQINTPITTDGTYLYFGTYTGYNTAGTYYQISTTGSLIGSFTPNNSYANPLGGFYWSGAAFDNNNVYFGSDNGMLYWQSRSAFGTTYGYLNLKDSDVGGVSDAGNVRSTIMIDDDCLFFTSQGGYLWCCSYDSSEGLAIDWKVALRNYADTANVTSTSTPTKIGKRIYVGCYGGSGKCGVKYIDATTHEEKFAVRNDSLPVQCSIVVKGTGTDSNFLDYIYFVTNAAAGTGYCYSWDGTTATLIWSSTGSGIDQTYALGGMAIDNGIAVYGNDHNYLTVVK